MPKDALKKRKDSGGIILHTMVLYTDAAPDLSYNICQTYLWFYCSVNVPVSGTWLQVQIQTFICYVPSL